ncbi:DLW-39 family protein [Nocardia sp. CDC159]|uniref:DLW-39 family protein n=1 Tax=Nocardia pulmonis TaxID=2951408 RepID=A0A9X2IZR1_9NOCA|nr:MULTISPECIES: DLW-39 family protein [Nocardia]MCM6776964.1 DLW-39 family protein [Nocardia pulmonis]MCM6789388.1 DLW-39 family protein [Nocardia sp. CDC159]
MKFILTLAVVAAVVFAIGKFRQRNEPDMWHQVTTR